MAGALREGSQGVGHPYLTALLLLAMIGGFYVSGGNNLSTFKSTPNNGEVTIVPQKPGSAQNNLQLYTFGYNLSNPNPNSSGSGVPTPYDPDPANPNKPLPDCPSHGIKTASCQCPTREEVWAYCDVDISTCQAPGVPRMISVPGKNPPGKQYCTYSQSLDDPIYQQKLQDPACTLACVN
jgi:hypothetical protein